MDLRKGDSVSLLKKAEFHLKQSIEYEERGNADSALFQKICAYNIYKDNLSDFQLSSALAFEIGSAYEAIGYYSLAIDYYQDAYDFYFEERDSVNLARILNQMGNISLDFNMQEDARKYYNDVLTYISTSDSLSVKARINANLGNSYYSEEQFDRALDYYLKARDGFLMLNDKVSVAKIQMAIGNTYFRLGSQNQARDGYMYAWRVFEQNNMEGGIAMVKHNLGNLEKKDGRYLIAEKYYLSSIAIKRELGMYRELVKSYESIADLYDLTNNYKKAFDYEKLNADLSDSLQNQMNYNRLYEFQTAVNIMKWQEDVNLLQKNIELSEVKVKNAELEIGRQRQIRQFLLVVLGIVLVLLVVLVFLFNSNRNKRIFLRENNELLNSLNSELKESIETKDKLFSIMAHDLKNPIVGLARLSKILYDNMEKIPPEKFEYFIREIYQSSNSLHVLLKNMTEWTAFKSNKIDYTPEEVDVKLIVNRVVALFKSLSEERKVKLICQFECDMKLFTDANLLSAIIRNLIGNAVKFTEYDSSVYVRTICNRDFYSIEVIDEGKDITDSELKQILKYGVDVNNIGNSVLKGTGLGLSICKDFASIIGGEIHAEKIAPFGTKFLIVIPLNKVL
jgi:signal transduction histidine kinase